MSRNQLSLTLRIAVFSLLVGSAVIACLVSERLFHAWQRAGSSPAKGHVVLGVFLAFVLALALDRWWAVRQRAYPAARALLQIAFAAALLTVLLPSEKPPVCAATELQSATPLTDEDSAEFLLTHPEPEVRAASCRLLGHAASLPVVDLVQDLALDDSHPEVQSACALALDRLSVTESETGGELLEGGP